MNIVIGINTVVPSTLTAFYLTNAEPMEVSENDPVLHGTFRFIISDKSEVVCLVELVATKGVEGIDTTFTKGEEDKVEILKQELIKEFLKHFNHSIVFRLHPSSQLVQFKKEGEAIINYPCIYKSINKELDVLISQEVN